MGDSVRCPRCGSSLPRALRFCDICGQELEGFKPPPAAARGRKEQLRRICGLRVELMRAMFDYPKVELAARVIASLSGTRLGGEDWISVNSWVHEAAAHPVPLAAVAEAAAARLDSVALKELFEMACEVAWQGDKGLNAAIRDTLRTVGRAFRIGEPVQRAIILRRFGLLACCEYILGVSRYASAEAKSAAYDRARSQLAEQLLRMDIPPPERERIRARIDELREAWKDLSLMEK